ncbi:MAG: site-specific DNA-methyltransferase [Chloroflexi bacterium]|nr:site-specific DNA-methyltransferase [Chloroflexota bacterium]
MSQRLPNVFDSLPTPVYKTRSGAAYLGDSMDLLAQVPDERVDLVVTSPPFALLRQKAYGNKDQAEYVDWLCSFGVQVRRVLRETGSFVLDLGGAYQRGVPVRSLYQYRVLLKMCDEVGFFLAEEFFWHNPAKLPSPIEWVNKRKLRAKDSVDTVWWFSKSECPKADIRNVLVPYSERMKTLLKNPEKFYKAKDRPSGHEISMGFGSPENGGAIPPNLLQIPNTESNSSYLRLAKLVGLEGHPARFPAALPEFFIKFLTDHDDLVVDIFAGSNTTGRVAEQLGRRWMAMELDANYVAASALRFMDHLPESGVPEMFSKVSAARRGEPVDLSGPLTLFETREATIGRLTSR